MSCLETALVITQLGQQADRITNEGNVVGIELSSPAQRFARLDKVFLCSGNDSIDVVDDMRVRILS